MENKTKKCENCGYFFQHYSKQDTAYDKVFCGHCRNRNNKKMQPIQNCELWEDISIKKEERKKSIKETLEWMSEHINVIAMILEDDKK